MSMQKADPGVVLAIGADRIVSAVPCGLVSIILTAGSDTATIKLYDSATVSGGTVIKALSAVLGTVAIYTPCKPDSFANGIVAVVTGTAATGYVSISS